MPYHQILALTCAFQSNGVDPSLYTVITAPDSSAHAMDLWFESDNGYPVTKVISARVIEFLDAHLK